VDGRESLEAFDSDDLGGSDDAPPHADFVAFKRSRLWDSSNCGDSDNDSAPSSVDTGALELQLQRQLRPPTGVCGCACVVSRTLVRCASVSCLPPLSTSAFVCGLSLF
jgi:hypothetical protein